MPAKIKMNKNVVLKNLKLLFATHVNYSRFLDIPEVEIQGDGEEHQNHVDPLSSQEDHLNKESKC